MNAAAKNRIVSWGAFLLLAAVLAVLAILQYRWSGEVSQAASTRMQEGLQTAMFRFREDLSREFAQVAQELNPAASEPHADARHFSERLRHWQETAAHRGLIEAVYVWEAATNTQPQFLRLNASTERFDAVSWPVEFSELHDHLQQISAGVAEL